MELTRFNGTHTNLSKPVMHFEPAGSQQKSGRLITQGSPLSFDSDLHFDRAELTLPGLAQSGACEIGQDVGSDSDRQVENAGIHTLRLDREVALYDPYTEYVRETAMLLRRTGQGVMGSGKFVGVLTHMRGV